MRPTEEFYSFTVTCALNVFLSYTVIMLNIVTIQAIRETFPWSKSMLLSLDVSDLSVGLTAQPLFVAVRVMELKETDNSRTYYATHIAFHVSTLVFLGVIIPCGGFNYRQILGYSPLSQIQGTCDSQARCCFGDVHMGVQRNYFVNPVVDPGQYLLRRVWNSFFSLCINCNTLDLQDLFTYSTARGQINQIHLFGARFHV